MRRRLIALVIATVVIGIATVPTIASGNESDQDKVAAIRELHEKQSKADPAIDAAFLAEEATRRDLEEKTRSVSPGVYFVNETTPFIRIYDGDDAKQALDAVNDDWPDAQTGQSQYSAAEIETLREIVSAIPLSKDEAFGADYSAEDDIFRITGTVDPEVVSRALSGHEYELVKDEASRTSRTNDGAPY